MEIIKQQTQHLSLSEDATSKAISAMKPKENSTVMN
jgi:hypothetical protein